MYQNRTSIKTQPPWRPLRRRSPGRILRGLHAFGGFTILEALVASVVILVALGAVFQVSARCMDIIRASRNVSLASAMLHERMQQLKSTNWETLTDSESYTRQTWVDPEDNSTETVEGLLDDSPRCGSELRQLGSLETVKVSAYRPTANGAPLPTSITAVKDSTGSRVTSAAADLSDEMMVRVDIRITWNDARKGTARSLGISSIVARK